jgi:hypothetical protein
LAKHYSNLLLTRENPMADGTHRELSEDNPRRLKNTVLGLAVIYVMTFLSGFLQATQYNFLNYIFFSLLSIGGIVLIRVTVESRATGMTRGVLFLTGVSTTVLLVFGIGYEWSRLAGYQDLEGSIEALLYLTTLGFWIGVIGSLVLIGRLGGRNSSQS